MDPRQLDAARRQLEQSQLIAYQPPLYQVLALPELSPEPTVPTGPRTGQTHSVADILRRALTGGAS
jgi:hypothetical protein